MNAARTHAMSSYPPLRAVEEKIPRSMSQEEYQLAPVSAAYTSHWEGATTPPKPSTPIRKSAPLDDRPGPAWILILALIAGAVGLVFYSIRQQQILGIVAAPILFVFGLHGIWRGGFRKLFMIPVVIVAAWWALKAPAAYGPAVQQFLRSADAGLTNMLIAACSIPILVLGLGLIQNFRRRVIMRHGLLYRFDRFVGTLVGLAEGGLVVLAICWTAIFMAPKLRETLSDENTPRNAIQADILEGVVKLSEEAQSGKIGEIVAKTNMLERYPSLKEKLDQWSYRIPNLMPSSVGGGGTQLNPYLKESPSSSIENFEKNAQQRNEQYEQLKKELPSQRQQTP